MSNVVSIEELQKRIGTETGVSPWITLDQPRIDAFAELTEDRQFIHVDPERAKLTPFGGTIAHGFLVLSMLSRMGENAMLVIAGVYMGVNYGFEKVRFVAPVRAGAKVRGRFVLEDAREREPGQWQLRYAVTVEIEGQGKPAVSAQWLTMQMVKPQKQN
jgi:acyl dehydratase